VDSEQEINKSTDESLKIKTKRAEKRRVWILTFKTTNVMKTYKAKLKHDNGIVYIRVLAENEREAIKRICDAEMCPERAIEKIIEIN